MPSIITFATTLNFANFAVNFNRHCLINNNISMPKNVINLYFLTY